MAAEDDLELIIFYHNREAFRCSCSSVGQDGKDTLRYWMGKSPGMFEDDIEKVITVPNDQIVNRTHWLSEIRQERFKLEDEYRERAQKREYERLSKIYGHG